MIGLVATNSEITDLCSEANQRHNVSDLDLAVIVPT
jgi:hypothetical protein